MQCSEIMARNTEMLAVIVMMMTVVVWRKMSSREGTEAGTGLKVHSRPASFGLLK